MDLPDERAASAEELRALPAELLALLRQPSPCFFATLMPDGAPQLTQTWVDTDGRHVLINTVRGHQKGQNIERNPRAAGTRSDPTRPSPYCQVRGRVIAITHDGAAEHVSQLS